MTTAGPASMPPGPTGGAAADDLSHCPALLAAFRSAQEVVATQGLRQLRSPAESDGSDGKSLTGLLAVLTCCYAKGIFGSWQVMEFLEDHPLLCELSGDRQPEADELREFRREHRSLLQAGLIRLLAYLYPTPEEAGAGAGTAPDAPGQLANANWQAWLTHEAESRIRSALQMDTLCLDE